jgi:hypothetical protein
MTNFIDWLFLKIYRKRIANLPKRVCDIDPGCNKSGPHVLGEARANQDSIAEVNYSAFVQANREPPRYGGSISSLRANLAPDCTITEERNLFWEVYESLIDEKWNPRMSNFVPREIEEDCLSPKVAQWEEHLGQGRGDEKCQSSVQKRTKKKRSKLKRRKPRQ